MTLKHCGPDSWAKKRILVGGLFLERERLAPVARQIDNRPALRVSLVEGLASCGHRPIIPIISIKTIAFGLSDRACNRFVSSFFSASLPKVTSTAKRCGTSITPCGKPNSIAIQAPFRFGTLGSAQVKMAYFDYLLARVSSFGEER
jgi:hypothetical protein